MSMNSVLGSALSGLRAAQAGLDLVSRNVANADSAGYTKKTLQQDAFLTGDKVSGVRIGDAQRQLDTMIQRQMWREASGAGYIDTIARYTSHMDMLLGEPGSPAALDGLFNSFTSALEELATSPDSFSERNQVLREGQALAQTLNQLSGDVQALREEAEEGIGDAVGRINELLAHIHRANSDLAGAGNPSADVLDNRDRYIAELSQLLDIRVIERDSGQVAVFTESGQLLLDNEPAEFVFDERGKMTPEAQYSADDGERGVGTVGLRSPGGQVIDLIQDRAIRSGELAALIELRDDTLVTAQNQLDALADSMAHSMSGYGIEGERLAGDDGHGIVLSDPPRAGDRLTLHYTDDNGDPGTVTFVHSDDPGSADPSGDAVAVDFTGGDAAFQAALDAELGAGAMTVQTNGDALEVMDGPDHTVTALTARVTATDFEEGVGLPFFIDGDGDEPYIGGPDGSSERLGFAGRIKVNPALFEDDSRLVRFGEDVPIGDSSRPLHMLEGLTARQHTFSGGLGVSGTTDYEGTVQGFVQRIVSHQGAQAADAERAKNAQEVVTAQLEERFTRHSGVNVDEEMARLIELQTAFQANTRVVSTHREMMNLLLQM